MHPRAIKLGFSCPCVVFSLHFKLDADVHGLATKCCISTHNTLLLCPSSSLLYISIHSEERGGGEGGEEEEESGYTIAELCPGKGLATADQILDRRRPALLHYDELACCRALDRQPPFFQRVVAIKNGKGLHSKKEVPIHRVADISGDTQKAKQFLPFLQRAGRSEAVVEYVFSGSRLKLYMPKETCLITFLLAGIECPRSSRNTPGGVQVAEPFSEEAMLFTKELVLQRESFPSRAFNAPPHPATPPPYHERCVRQAALGGCQQSLPSDLQEVVLWSVDESQCQRGITHAL
ncbi:unnamed protein product [Pleuronectes platessa]|uniref:TNase-like domain-containing protein n=1 Tax=Pleuronectes platessa TaxID=8262 RepID=A0A9N7W113_PLEPL|nr:unnamed protein product [Pleuronectes platessa]